MIHAVLGVCLLALALAACSGRPLGRDVVAQANRPDEVAFDVVKIDDAVVETLAARPPPAFAGRFREYRPPPDLKIAVGDTVSVVIWESAADGLFGNSLTELSFPAGATARLRTGQAANPLLMPTRPSGLTASPDTLSLLLGLAPPSTGGQAQPPAGASALLETAGQEPRGGVGLAAATAASEAVSGRGAPSALSGLAPHAGAVTNNRPVSPTTGGRTAQQRLDDLLALANQSGRPGTRIPDQQVDADGAISIPYAGRIAAANHTPAEVQRQIERLLAAKALDPQALVVVRPSAANSVSVAGEVVGGKRVPLSPGGERLLQVIAAAGGARAPVHETFVRLSRGGVTASVPLATLVARPEQNIFAEPGDVLTLVRQRKSFSVFGATGKNAAIDFLGDRLTLAEALGRAGGLLDDRADPRAVFLLRYEPVDVVRALGQPIAAGAPAGLSPVAYRLDLKEAKSYLLAKRFPVHDKDVILVTNAESVPIYRVFQALTTLTGPVQTAAIACITAKC